MYSFALPGLAERFAEKIQEEKRTLRLKVLENLKRLGNRIKARDC
jgi:hypothetical protein